ncbi:MAG TPA: hypothetical protein DEB40_12635 [Elusimicrobia bacterium]|nr:hypothetical protein [Elusimicrobiota bacterium]HBT62580.1 hypothetical protein [Elusimicrobiota bacterium]
MKTRAGYRVIAHTSEVGLEITGRDWPAFYLHAASGLLALYALAPSVKADARVTRSFKARNAEELLVCWLSELIFLIETERRVPGRIDFVSAGPKVLKVRIHGDAPRPEKLPLAREIKAVTYHGLKVRQGRLGMEARIILDV